MTTPALSDTQKAIILGDSVPAKAKAAKGKKSRVPCLAKRRANRKSQAKPKTV